MKAAILSVLTALAGAAAAHESLLSKRDDHVLCDEVAGEPSVAAGGPCSSGGNTLTMPEIAGQPWKIPAGDCNTFICSSQCGISTCNDGDKEVEVTFGDVGVAVDDILNKCEHTGEYAGQPDVPIVKGQAFREDRNWNVIIKEVDCRE